MTDTPDRNPYQFPARQTHLRQLSAEPESGDSIPFPTVSQDTPPAPGEPNSIPTSSESSNSQLTSSDKLSALPSHLRSSPAGRSAISPLTKHDSLEGLEHPSTLETRLPPPSASRPPPISHSQSESAVERETPSRQRVSFDSDRGSSTSPRPSNGQSPLPLPTASEPILPSVHGGTFASRLIRAHEAVHGRVHHDSSLRHGHSRKTSQVHKDSAELHTQPHSRTGSPPRSPSPLRAISPLRTFFDRFSPLGRVHSREDPFIPIDPFQMHLPLSLNPFARCFGVRRQPADVEVAVPASQSDISCMCACVPLFGSARFHSAHIIALDTLPRQLYLHSQLRLPSLYFSRVARIFEDAAVSRPEIQRVIDACESVGVGSAQHRTTGLMLPFPEEWVPPNVSPALARFKRSWESFVESLVREWKTLNVLSALLLSAILTLFQIPDAAGDPLTRTAALCSLVSALMSLSYGIMYIVRFGNMRSMYRASRWAEEAQKTETSIFWNVWVLLALPGVWLAWSVLAFVVAIMSFVWRTGARGDSHPALSPSQEFGPRLAITCELLLGLVYFVLVIRTFRSYGESGRKARVVRRLADVQIELETRREWTRESGRRDDVQAQGRRENEEEGTQERRGRTRASESPRLKGQLPTNQLGLSGMDRKQDVMVHDGGDVATSESFSSLGI